LRNATVTQSQSNSGATLDAVATRIKEEKETRNMAEKPAPFERTDYLATAGPGRKILQFKAHQAFFTQGNHADTIFYLQKGRASLTVLSQAGKEATITLLAANDFIGEEAMAAMAGLRMATATATTACTALKIERSEMIRVMHAEPTFSDFFLSFLLARSMRTQADLVDQLFNSSEKRLARILLLMAEFGQQGEPESMIPKITQETLAEMIGTTRSRVSFFMNCFRKMGFIEYNGRIHVHKSLLNVVLYDQAPSERAARPSLLGVTKNESKTATSVSKKLSKIEQTGPSRIIHTRLN
jgi:CRP/FNR family cyclic AMP-dependent transcriptional regulator